MSNSPKIALVMIVKPADSEAKVLERCLAAASPHVDGIFLTITGENELCTAVSKKYGAVMSRFDWIHDFAAARNFALEQVSDDYQYWTWLDCDDVPRGYEKLHDTLAEHPEVDAFIFNYLYDFDEWKNPIVVHAKSRVFKHDHTVTWVGAIHEDFDYGRDINAQFVKGIDVLHLTDEERIADSSKRNLEVAGKEVEKSPDDPRSFWNLANALKMVGSFNEAIDAFMQFIKTSKSEDEKFVAHMRMAEIRLQTNEFGMALDHSRYAIGLRPRFPEGYHMAGHTLFAMERFADAAEYFKWGLKEKPSYHRATVFNPRDYDYHPMMALAKTYFQLNLPQLSLPLLEACLTITPQDKALRETVQRVSKESVKIDNIMAEVKRMSTIEDDQMLIIELASLPDDFKSHPMVCKLRNERLVKTESSGRDLVIYCAYTEEEWTPETAKTKGIGGSEEAVIHLAKRLKEKGWKVTVYNNCGHKDQVFDGVLYRPHWAWNYNDRQDVTVLWRHPKFVDYHINTGKLFIDLHDVIPAAEFTPERLKKIDGIFVKSKAHRAIFKNVPDEKFHIIPNGIVWADLNHYDGTAPIRNPKLIVNTSSPDRSLSTLIELFEKVKEQVPDAELEWCYGWRGWDNAHGDDPKKAEWKKNLLAKMALLGIKELGRLSHGDVAELYQKAAVFAYPTAFYEIDCISARKAQAAGAVPVATDFAALDETIKYGDKVHVNPEEENWGKPGQFDFAMMGEVAKSAWVKNVVERLKNPMTEEQRMGMRTWTERFDWNEIATEWDKIISV